MSSRASFFISMVAKKKKKKERKVTNNTVYSQSAINITFGPNDCKKEINSEVLST